MELELPATPPSVRAARSAVSRAPAVLALDPQWRDDVVLIVSELVSNAVAAAPAGTSVAVRVEEAPGCLTVEVRNVVDDAPHFPERPSMPPPPQPNGRGLALVHRMSTAVFTSVDHHVLTVTAVLQLDDARRVVTNTSDHDVNA